MSNLPDVSRVAALVPWAWGINGCASVLSAVLAILLAMSLKFNAVVVIATADRPVRRRRGDRFARAEGDFGERIGERPAPRLDPVVQVSERELGLVDVDVDVHEIGVGLVAAKVVPQTLSRRASLRSSP